MKKLNPQKVGGSDEFQTPKIAIKPLLPYINKDWTIWEAAWGLGYLAKHLTECGYSVIGGYINDFFETVCPWGWDCIITNPPYSIKDKFIERCYDIGSPFALLLPLTALEGKKRGTMFSKYGIQLIVPNKRINFITPSGKGSGAWFQTAWFCYKFNLPKDLNFVEI